MTPAEGEAGFVSHGTTVGVWAEGDGSPCRGQTHPRVRQGSRFFSRVPEKARDRAETSKTPSRRGIFERLRHQIRDRAPEGCGR